MTYAFAVVGYTAAEACDISQGFFFFHLICHANSPEHMTKFVIPVLHVILSTNTVRDLIVTGEVGGLAFNIWAGN
jgi:hypothetical protein